MTEQQACTLCGAGGHTAAQCNWNQAEAPQGERVPDEAFEAEFMTWWEEHGQYCRSGGGDYERTFAFQAWRHLYPKLMQARATPAQPCQLESGVETFLGEVRAELTRARKLFPGDRIMTIALAEEFGELCKAILDEPSANVRKEAVQTAVMAARVILDGDGSVNEWRAAKGLDPLVKPALAAPAKPERFAEIRFQCDLEDGWFRADLPGGVVIQRDHWGDLKAEIESASPGLPSLWAEGQGWADRYCPSELRAPAQGGE